MIAFLAALMVAGGVIAAVAARVAARQRQVEDLRAALELQALSPAKPENAERTSKLLARSGLAAEKALADVDFLDTPFANRRGIAEHRTEQLVGHPVGGCLDQLLARLEVLIGGAAVDPGEMGDFGQAHAFGPVFGEQGARRLENHLARRRGIAWPPFPLAHRRSLK